MRNSLCKVVFLLDHPSRDLLQSCLIGSQLNNEYSIDFQDGYFGPTGPSFFKRAKFSERYIISPSYNVTRTPNLKFRKEYNNAKLILLHSEQLLAPVAYFEKFNLDNVEEYINDVDLHLVWNMEFKKLLAFHGVPENKIKIVGNPKYDVLKIMTRKELPVKKGKILFIASFNAADFNDSEWRTYCKEYFLEGHDDLNRSYKEIRDNFAKSIKSLESYCKENNKIIVIRKHPGESIAFYENLQSETVKISTEQELQDDMVDSEIIFTFSSSVVFESYILKIPTFAIEWSKLSVDLMQIPSEEYNWQKPDNILDIVKNPLNYKTAIDSMLFEKYFSNIHVLASSTAAAILNEFIDDNPSSNKRNYSLLLSGAGLNLVVKTVVNYLAILEPKIVFKFFYDRVNESYNNWIKNDHYVSRKVINESKIKAKRLLR